MTERAGMNERAALPSGYSEVVHTDPSIITPQQLPRLSEQVELSTVRCVLEDGTSFLFASAVGTHPVLTKAADAMTEQQTTNCNNMLYSRMAGFVMGGFSSSLVDKVAKSQTSITESTFALRNNGGQRVYFCVISPDSSEERLIVRIAAADKNNVAKIYNVISSGSGRAIRQKAKRGSN